MLADNSVKPAQFLESTTSTQCVPRGEREQRSPKMGLCICRGLGAHRCEITALLMRDNHSAYRLRRAAPGADFKPPGVLI